MKSQSPTQQKKKQPLKKKNKTAEFSSLGRY